MYPLITIFFMSSNLIMKLSNYKIIHFLGKAFFEVYLWHFPLLGISQFFIRMFHITVPQNNFSMALFAIFTFLFSMVAYKYIEIPINKWIVSAQEKKTKIKKD